MNILLLLLYWGLWYLNFTARTILAPLLPLIEDALSINHAMAGSFFLAFYIGNTTALFSAGPVSLRLGYKRTILISILIMAVSYALLRFVDSYQLFMAVAVVLGFSAGFYLPCAIPLITSSFDKAHWGKAISFHETAAGFSILTVPFLVVLLLRFVAWPSIFLFLAVFCLVMAALSARFSPDPRPSRDKSARLSLVLRRREFWILTVLWVACGIASLGLYNLIPLFLVTERGMAVAAANTIFGFSRAGGFAAMVMIGFFLDRLDVRKTMFTLLLITGAATIGMALIHTNWLLIVMLLVQATASVVFFPVILVALTRLTSLSERGMFTGALMGISSIVGPGLSPVILGAVADRWTFQIGILGVGIVITAACLLFNQLREI